MSDCFSDEKFYNPIILRSFCAEVAHNCWEPPFRSSAKQSIRVYRIEGNLSSANHFVSD